MASQSTKKRIGTADWLLPSAFLVLILFVWEIITHFFSIPEFLLPGPMAIGKSIFSDRSVLLFHAGITLSEAVCGFIIANLFGVAVGTLFAYSKTLKRGLYPFAIALKTTPIIAIAPLFILWFGNGPISKIAAAAIISFFPAVVNTTRGLKSVSQDSLDLFKSFSAKSYQLFMKLRFPTALPYIFSALKISSSLAVVGAIVGEFVGANKGMGYFIIINYYHFEIVKVFSGVVVVALTGILFFGVISMIEKKVIFWAKIDE